MHEPASTMTLSRTLRRKQILVAIAFALCVIWLLSDRIFESICITYASIAGTSFCSSGLVNSDWNLFYHLGGNGPWIPKIDGTEYRDAPFPDGCVVDQVHMVSDKVI
jgi:hypothetical protein